MGRKRHLLVDTLGLVLKADVHPADWPDRKGVRPLLEAVKGQFPRLSKIWADQGYAGAVARWAGEFLQVSFEIVYPWWRQIKRYHPEIYKTLDKGCDSEAIDRGANPGVADVSETTGQGL